MSRVSGCVCQISYSVAPSTGRQESLIPRGVGRALTEAGAAVGATTCGLT
jgi:hypothetical protein